MIKVYNKQSMGFLYDEKRDDFGSFQVFSRLTLTQEAQFASKNANELTHMEA
jgi:hypothetical protein